MLFDFELNLFCVFELHSSILVLLAEDLSGRTLDENSFENIKKVIIQPSLEQ